MFIKLYIYYSFSLSANSLLAMAENLPLQINTHTGLARAYATGSISTYISMCVLRHGLCAKIMLSKELTMTAFQQ